MNVSDSGSHLQTFSCAEESGGSKAPSSGEEGSLSVKYGGNGSDVGPISFDAWKSLYERTAVVNTARLTLSHPQFTEKEYELVDKLNEAFRNGGSRWTVLEIPENTPRHIVKSLLQITEVAGDFFTRTWFIREQLTACLIGMMQTSALDKSGLSEVDRHLQQNCCGKGYGTEALKGIVDMYQPYTGKRMLMPSFSERKEKLTVFLSSIVPFYLEEDDASEFFRAVDRVSEDTHTFSHPLIDKFPLCIGRVLTVALAPLSQCKRVDFIEYRGLWAYASTAASAPSLKKCGFVKKGEDKWYCFG